MRPLTQAKPVGLVRENQPEPARLFALEGFAEGQQHLVLQKSTPEQHLLLKGGLGQVLGGMRGARDARLLEGAFSPLPHTPATCITFLKSTQMKKPAPRLTKGIPRARRSSET